MAGKPLRVGVVMDPIGSITPYKDSSLAMLLEAARRGADIHYFEQGDLRIIGGEARGSSRALTVRDDNDDWYELGDASDVRLGDLDTILMRKDPPFNMEYVYTTYVLDRARKAGALIVNHPEALRNMNEKAYTAWFPECTPDTLITRSMQQMKAFLAKHGRAVFKPLDGMGGRSIFVVTKGDKNANVIIETLTDYGRRFAMAQQYIAEISEGDKRILLINGEAVPYALARVPSDEDNRGNIVAGATTHGRELSDADRRICERVGPALRDAGVIFAGIDVIGD
ncbi:MAG: glutathione synthase, partial [Woeseiaceae bacterium]|nr:glutathione synthase [Woeseiaceae bacterium]